MGAACAVSVPYPLRALPRPRTVAAPRTVMVRAERAIRFVEVDRRDARGAVGGWKTDSIRVSPLGGVDKLVKRFGIDAKDRG